MVTSHVKINRTRRTVAAPPISLIARMENVFLRKLCATAATIAQTEMMKIIVVSS